MATRPDEPVDVLDDELAATIDPELLNEDFDHLDDALKRLFDDDSVPDAALFLPFRDGRPGWR